MSWNPSGALSTVPLNAGPRSEPWALHSLPPLPAVALELLGLLDDSQVPLRRISALLRIDPALSAEVLRVANSALYGVSRRVEEISHAALVLGSEVIKRIALTVAINRFSRNAGRDRLLRKCWDHSLATALLAERLAPSLGQESGRAYMAGLLHDVGRLALIACYPAEYAHLLAVVREYSLDELESERELFDIDHCEAGCWLAEEWKLPEAFAHAIARHHESDCREGPLVSLVAAAHALAEALGYPVGRDETERSVTEIIDSLPVEDKAGLSAAMQDLELRIDKAVGLISPAALE